jgi:hypothetical protein
MYSTNQPTNQRIIRPTKLLVGVVRYTPQALVAAADHDDDDEDLSVGRESRIEELARRMMSKVDEVKIAFFKIFPEFLGLKVGEN